MNLTPVRDLGLRLERVALLVHGGCLRGPIGVELGPRVRGDFRRPRDRSVPSALRPRGRAGSLLASKWWSCLTAVLSAKSWWFPFGSLKSGIFRCMTPRATATTALCSALTASWTVEALAWRLTADPQEVITTA